MRGFFAALRMTNGFDFECDTSESVTGVDLLCDADS